MPSDQTITLPEASALLYKQVSRFSNLDEYEWQMLEPHLSIRQLKRHEYFIREGKKGNEVGMVLQGTLRQFYTKDGVERTTYFFFEGHLMSAYISCLSATPSLVSIEALSDTTYISFPYDVLVRLYQRSMGWQQFGRRIAEYIATGLEQRMAGLLLLSPEERYRELLSGSKSLILERVPQQYVANYLGITPVSMSRIRNRLLKKPPR